MCSQPWTARMRPASFTAGRMPFKMAWAASALELEPMRLPTVSLVEQPRTMSWPGLGLAALSRMSMASRACWVIASKSIS